jgi:hypothetical protein
MGVAGRKSWTEELQIARKYSALSDKYFEFLMEMLDSEEKADRKWASERLEKAYVKMIPQDVTTGGQPINISFDSAFKDGASSQTEGDS